MRYYYSLIAIAIIGITIYSACEKAAPTASTAQTNTAATPPPSSQDPAANAPRISLTDAKKDFDAGSAVFVDTRAELTFKQEHIKGAINISAETFETRYKEIPTGRKIIAYCS
jgi:3-mercaptopyruvate sulfurtransferase SseA